MPKISEVCCTFARVADLRNSGALRGQTLLTVIRSLAVDGPTQYARETAAAMIAGNPQGNADFAEWFEFDENAECEAELQSVLIVAVIAPKSQIEGVDDSGDLMDLLGSVQSGYFPGKITWTRFAD